MAEASKTLPKALSKTLSEVEGSAVEGSQAEGRARVSAAALGSTGCWWRQPQAYSLPQPPPAAFRVWHSAGVGPPRSSWRCSFCSPPPARHFGKQLASTERRKRGQAPASLCQDRHCRPGLEPLRTAKYSHVCLVMRSPIIGRRSKPGA